MKTITENLETKISDSCDVFVAGGGIAGIAAALSASRCGAKVIMCDREYTLGGLATLGLITIYLPLCDGYGRQVSKGIAEELLLLSAKYGVQAKYPKPWFENGTIEEKCKTRYELQYNPHVFASLAEELLLKEGVKILYATTVCSAVISDGRITNMIIENKSGRSAIEVKSVVDATGDADVVYMSGEDTEVNPNGNPMAAWYYSSEAKGNSLNMLGAADIPDYDDKSKYVIESISNKRYAGVDAEELSDFVINMRKQIMKKWISRRQSENVEISQMPTIPQLRMTRRLKGRFELDMCHAGMHFDDSVGMIGNWRKPAPAIEIPFASLYGNKVKNLITAGRCISSVGDMWDLTRVIPACAVTGQASGAAAAMGEDFESVDISKLQAVLEDAGVELHI